METSELVPGRKYKFKLEDCCVRVELTGAVFATAIEVAMNALETMEFESC